MLGMGKVPPPWGETLPSSGGNGELSGIHITKNGEPVGGTKSLPSTEDSMNYCFYGSWFCVDVFANVRWCNSTWFQPGQTKTRQSPRTNPSIFEAGATEHLTLQWVVAESWWAAAVRLLAQPGLEGMVGLVGSEGGSGQSLFKKPRSIITTLSTLW